MAKTKKSKSVKNIDENEILSRGEYIGDTYYGEPYHSRRSKYYKYNDKFYEFTEGSDEYGGWEEVDSFVMTHPKPGYERYSASTKKSELASKSFNDMVKEQRDKNRIGKSNWQDSGTVAFENLPTPESLAKSIWGDLTNLIADACDTASFNTDTEVEICAGLADDYYSRVAEALIPMLQNFVDENKWS